MTNDLKSPQATAPTCSFTHRGIRCIDILGHAGWRSEAWTSHTFPSPQPTAESAQPQRFTKKPVTVEALLYDGTNQKDIFEFTHGGSYTNYEGGAQQFVIRTLEGRHIASVGDYIIKGVKGEFYPCKPDIFALTYVPAPPAESERVAPPTEIEIYAKALEIAVDDISDIDRGAKYTVSNYLAAARRRFYE